MQGKYSILFILRDKTVVASLGVDILWNYVQQKKKQVQQYYYCCFSRIQENQHVVQQRLCYYHQLVVNIVSSHFAML